MVDKVEKYTKFKSLLHSHSGPMYGDFASNPVYTENPAIKIWIDEKAKKTCMGGFWEMIQPCQFSKWAL